MSGLKLTYDSEGNKYIRYKHASYSCDKNINDIVLIGKCIAKKEFDKYKKLTFCSDILINPTYKDLLIIANDIVEYAECRDHHFFLGGRNQRVSSWRHYGN